MGQPMWGKGGFGKGYGGGMSHRNFKSEQKVWIGNLAEGVTFKELQPHMKQAGTAKWVEVFSGKGKGTGVACYATEAEATAAIAALNGSVLNGQAIEVDVWTKKPKGEGKGYKNFKNEQKVWIGNLPEGVTYKELQPHMKQAGNAKWVECVGGKGSKGTGVACYETEAEATAAIAALNGSVLSGQAIEVDVWTKKPKGEGKGA